MSGIVERITFHSPETGWSVIKVAPFSAPHTRVTVTLHQVKVFAGASFEFHGSWTQHPKYGEQFVSTRAVERKPASTAALEKYLGSGLIRGVGPKTARKIVKHFGDETLDVFDEGIERLTEVRGIAKRKLETIADAWREHRSIRDVMMFLQQHGISTLYAVKIYQAYGEAAIGIVEQDPYRLAKDIYGIGFFSADRIARSLGFDVRGAPRIDAGIQHVLAASREAGHCFLTRAQVQTQTIVLLDLGDPAQLDGDDGQLVASALETLAARDEVRVRELAPSAIRLEIAPGDDDAPVRCYYSRSLYRDEETTAREVRGRLEQPVEVDLERVERWLEAYCAKTGLDLSPGQRAAVIGIARERFSILTGGPGCGKTTTTQAIVRLALAMGKRVMLAAPTGRAAQRMGEVVGLEAKTLHRLLEWSPQDGGFTRDRDNPLETDFIVVDETSMLDISLAASLLAAVPPEAQTLFVGDPNQLPSVGAGDVLADLLRTPAVPRFELSEVFRQASASHIIRFAHEINRGEVPAIPSPIAQPDVWKRGDDCLFVDAEEATGEQLRFVKRAKALIARTVEDERSRALVSDGQAFARIDAREDHTGVEVTRTRDEPSSTDDAGEPFSIPRKFLHVDLEKLAATEGTVAELREVMGRLHPHSVLHHGYSLADAVRRLYTKTIPEQLGLDAEIQILSPMNRGSAGAHAMNAMIQEAVTPAAPGRPELRLGERVFRVGDRVIQRRNNYNLGVFNGDIGKIVAADAEEMTCEVSYRSGEGQQVVGYTKADLVELGLAYAITVHKSQGSEFGAVIIPLVTQHFRMLFRGLVYTGLTRAKKLAIFVGDRRALGIAVRNTDSSQRQTALTHLLRA